MSVFAFGYNELEGMPDIKKIEKCPSCGKRHRVGQPRDTDGVPLGIGIIVCTKTKKSYIVGVRGKRIPQKRKL